MQDLEAKLRAAQPDNSNTQWATMAIGVLLIVQLGCASNQSVRESGQSQLDDMRSFKDLLTFLFRVVVCLRKGSQNAQELKSEVYRLKLLNQEMREDSEQWSKIANNGLADLDA